MISADFKLYKVNTKQIGQDSSDDYFFKEIVIFSNMD